MVFVIYNNIGDVIYLISFLITLSLGFFVLLKGMREEINRTFFLSVIFASGWLLTLFLFYNIEAPKAVLFIGRLNFAFVLPLLYYLLRFSIVFPKIDIKISRSFLKIIGLWIIFFSLLTLFTPLIGKEEIVLGPRTRETVYGPLYFLYILHYVVFTIAITYLLAIKTKKSTDISRRQIIYVLLGLFLALFFGFTTNILLPLFGLFGAQNYGPLAPVIFSVFVVFSIFKHHLFNIKVIATELFTGVLLLILLINTLTFESVERLIIDLLIFLSSTIFGILLIRSVLLEVKTRERLEKLSLDLEQANIELKKADRAKTEFLSMASHQLRTPLTAIKGYISLALEGHYGQLPEKLERAIKNVYESNERLIKLTNDLLTISRVEMGKLEAEKKETDILELIYSCLQEVIPEVEKKGLQISFEHPKEIKELKLNIDPLKIRQVILNIIDNAIKYTHQGQIKITLEILAKKVVVKVSDTGVGMSKEEQEHLFESFSRGRAGISLFIEGTGLGLHVAKKFVELHGGKIWAYSEGEGKGSTFIIELPKE